MRIHTHKQTNPYTQTEKYSDQWFRCSFHTAEVRWCEALTLLGRNIQVANVFQPASGAIYRHTHTHTRAPVSAHPGAAALPGRNIQVANVFQPVNQPASRQWPVEQIITSSEWDLHCPSMPLMLQLKIILMELSPAKQQEAVYVCVHITFVCVHLMVYRLPSGKLIDINIYICEGQSFYYSEYCCVCVWVCLCVCLSLRFVDLISYIICLTASLCLPLTLFTGLCIYCIYHKSACQRVWVCLWKCVCVCKWSAIMSEQRFICKCNSEYYLSNNKHIFMSWVIILWSMRDLRRHLPEVDERLCESYVWIMMWKHFLVGGSENCRSLDYLVSLTKVFSQLTCSVRLNWTQVCVPSWYSLFGQVWTPQLHLGLQNLWGSGSVLSKINSGAVHLWHPHDPN